MSVRPMEPLRHRFCCLCAESRVVSQGERRIPRRHCRLKLRRLRRSGDVYRQDVGSRFDLLLSTKPSMESNMPSTPRSLEAIVSQALMRTRSLILVGLGGFPEETEKPIFDALSVPRLVAGPSSREYRHARAHAETSLSDTARAETATAKSVDCLGTRRCCLPIVQLI